MADTDMIDITARLVHWLRRNNIDPEGVKLVIEMPDIGLVHAAEMSLKREVKPYAVSSDELRHGRGPSAINGVGLEFRYARKS